MKNDFSAATDTGTENFPQLAFAANPDSRKLAFVMFKGKSKFNRLQSGLFRKLQTVCGLCEGESIHPQTGSDFAKASNAFAESVELTDLQLQYLNALRESVRHKVAASKLNEYYGLGLR